VEFLSQHGLGLGGHADNMYPAAQPVIDPDGHSR